MSGKFNGLSDEQWTLLEAAFPESETKYSGRGMPRVPLRHALNSVLFVLLTGSRWCDLPNHPQFASKSSAHRSLKRWGENGTLFNVMQRLLSVADARQLIDWSAGSADGSFSPR